MSATAGGRDDYDTLTLRGLSRTSEDLHQARRLLSLACVYDGMSRADAAKGGGVARQSLRDRGHRFNEAGPEGLFDRQVPRPRWLNLLRSSNPAPALSMTLEHDGGVRWRRLDLQRGDRRPVRCCLSREDPLQAACSARLFPPHRAPATPGPGLGPRPGPHGGFQKNVPQSLASPLTHGPADRLIEVRVQNEVRIWARKGERPRWPAGQRYKSACLFGAVCADRETGAALMLPWCHGGGHWNKEPASQGDQPARCKRRSGRRPDGPRAGAHIRRGEGAGDPDPDLPARQITGTRSGREGLAISSEKRALQPPLLKIR